MHISSQHAISGHYLPTSEMALDRCFAVGGIITPFNVLTGSKVVLENKDCSFFQALRCCIYHVNKY